MEKKDIGSSTMFSKNAEKMDFSKAIKEFHSHSMSTRAKLDELKKALSKDREDKEISKVMPEIKIGNLSGK